MMKVEFTGSATEILAEMRLLTEPTFRTTWLHAKPDEEKLMSREELGAVIAEKEKMLAALGEPPLPGVFEPAPPRPDDEATVLPPWHGKPAPAEPEKPKRTRRTKAEIEAAKAAEYAAMTPAEHADEDNLIVKHTADEAAAEDKPVDFDACKDILKAVCEADGLGVEAAQALLKEFGVARLSLLAEAKWEEFYGRAGGLLEGVAQ